MGKKGIVIFLTVCTGRQKNVKTAQMVVSFKKWHPSWVPQCCLICRNISCRSDQIRWFQHQNSDSNPFIFVLLASYTLCRDIWHYDNRFKRDDGVCKIPEIARLKKYGLFLMTAVGNLKLHLWGDGKSEWGGVDVCVLLLDLVLWFPLTNQIQDISIPKHEFIKKCCVCNKYESKA